MSTDAATLQDMIELLSKVYEGRGTGADFQCLRSLIETMGSPAYGSGIDALLAGRIAYSIGRNPFRKNSTTLHLWRHEGSMSGSMAKFTSHETARQFAKDYNFPLSDAECEEQS